MEHEDYLGEIISVMEILKGKDCKGKIEEISNIIIDNYNKGGILLICGNGGSAADAQHFAAEHVGAYLNRDRKALPAIALTTDTSNLTAIANDYGYENVFLRQLKAFDNFNYVLIGISTSGNSLNINNAIKHANKLGKVTIGISGKSGGLLAEISKVFLTVPSGMTPIIQTAHNAIYHRVCEIVEKKMVE